MVAGSGQHALDLVVLALLQHDFQLVLAALDAGLRRQRRRFVMQLHAGQHLAISSSVTGSAVVAW
jgi:hypothetical protein